MNALRYLVSKARPLNELINDCIEKTPSVRIGMLKRNMMGETYEGAGKTTGYILNKKGISVICIDCITSQGFELTNGWHVYGSTIFFPHTLLSWNVKSFEDINEVSLSLFAMLQPKLDCLFLGYGCREEMTFTKLKELLNLLKQMKINTELLTTLDAAAAFNFCSLDRRFIAAALIPPQKIILHQDMSLIKG